VDGGRNFYFLEMNTRLQVEHPETELVTGIDIVREQFRIAAGNPLGFRQDDIAMRGWALECRIYAEDPERAFFPSPGIIRRLYEPHGPGIRIDSGVYEGWDVPIHYDPLIAKLVAHGPDRSQAVARMRRALAEYRIEGIKTTVGFFGELLGDPQFLAGDLSTGFIEEFFARRGPAAPVFGRDREAFALAAAVAYRDAAPDGVARGRGESAWKMSARSGSFVNTLPSPPTRSRKGSR
jgi:acetyl/propionyl-CoA carboxylase alpha subunit